MQGFRPPGAFGRAAASPQTRQMRCWLSAAQAAYHSFPSLPPTKTRSLRCTAFFPPKPLRWVSAGVLLGAVIKTPVLHFFGTSMWGVVSLPSERFTRFGNPAWPGVRTANFAAFGSWPGVLSKNAESLRDSDALMRVAVPRRRGPAGLRDPVAVSLAALMGFTVLLSRFVGTQKIERLFFSWYKISIAPEAYRKPRKLCLFLL